jgi:Tfp pilus assembly protein PilZ
MSEQRLGTRRQQKDPRVTVRLRARISSIDPETDPITRKPYYRVCDELCTNVSRGGIFVTTGEPLETDRRVLLEIEIPGQHTVQAVGRVAWSKVLCIVTNEATAAGTGIEFVGTSRENFATLEKLIYNALPRARPQSAQSHPNPPRA